MLTTTFLVPANQISSFQWTVAENKLSSPPWCSGVGVWTYKEIVLICDYVINICV